jgi:translation initiation factor 1
LLTVLSLFTILFSFEFNKEMEVTDEKKQDGLNSVGVHIRVQQRNGRKAITTIQGLDPKLNFRRVNREFQQRWGCNGTVIDDKEFGKVIQLQGNWSDNIKQFLIEERLASEGTMKVHSL